MSDGQHCNTCLGWGGGGGGSQVEDRSVIERTGSLIESDLTIYSFAGIIISHSIAHF